MFLQVKFLMVGRQILTGVFAIVICLPKPGNAQSGSPFPALHDALHYTIIPFKAKADKKGSRYIFKIAAGEFLTQSLFNQHIYSMDTSALPNALLEVPSFGKPYTWQYTVANVKGHPIYESPLYTFTTMISPWVDTNLFRIRVTHMQAGNQVHYMALDYARCIFNENGKPVWFLKNIPGVVNDTTLVRDLKQTSRGTLTFLNETTGYEVDYDCRVIWKTPARSCFNPDSLDNLHHDFTRLPNGHYMALGDEYLYRKVPATFDSLFIKDSPLAKYENGRYYLKLRLGNLLEWDTAGKLVWYWRSHDFFTDSFLFAGDARLRSFNISPHFNAFDIDLVNKQVYASCRDISTLLRIDYPSRKVVNQYYGFQMNSTDSSVALFNAQHSCKVDSNGVLYFFNNNAFLDESHSASILFTRQENNRLLRLKEVTNPFITENRKNSMRGGNVVQTKEGDYLCDMGSINYCFRFDAKGNITWNAIIEKKIQQQWKPFTQYRIASIDIARFFTYTTNIL